MNIIAPMKHHTHTAQVSRHAPQPNLSSRLNLTKRDAFSIFPISYRSALGAIGTLADILILLTSR